MGSASDEFVEEHVCTVCHVAILQDHPTLLLWLKCPLCGFCKLKRKKEQK